MSFQGIVQSTLSAVAVSATVYFLFLALLTVPLFQNQVIYLHRVALTWFKDVNYPERWGFLHNQVTPFFLQTPDGEKLHAWHILPLALYHRHEQALLQEPGGAASNITSRKSFELLRDDPRALLVLYLHGAAGTLGSGWRPPSYRALYAGAPDRVHTIAIDYRGFGQSTGTPSEKGLLTDALTLADWAMNVAGIPPSRIVLFGQSIGTAVSLSLAHHLAIVAQKPVFFAGIVLVAPFTNATSLSATYRLAGTVPILSPIASSPFLFDYFSKLIVDKWSSKDRISELVQYCENFHPGRGKHEQETKYHITIIHAEDDYDIPWTHSEQLFFHAVNATTTSGITYEELEKEKQDTKTNLGAGGWSVERRARKGIIREEIIKHGLHDVIMSYPVVSMAVLRAFQNISTEIPRS